MDAQEKKLGICNLRWNMGRKLWLEFMMKQKLDESLAAIYCGCEFVTEW